MQLAAAHEESQLKRRSDWESVRAESNVVHQTGGVYKRSGAQKSDHNWTPIECFNLNIRSALIEAQSELEGIVFRSGEREGPSFLQNLLLFYSFTGVFKSLCSSLQRVCWATLLIRKKAITTIHSERFALASRIGGHVSWLQHLKVELRLYWTAECAHSRCPVCMLNFNLKRINVHFNLFLI